MIALDLAIGICLYACAPGGGDGERSSDDFVKWARQAAVPIDSVEPGSSFDDLQPLKQIVGRARLASCSFASRAQRTPD